MPELTRDQEKQVCEILNELGWFETEHALHAEGVRAIQGVLHSSAEDAKAMLGELRARKLIDVGSTPGGQPDAGKPVPAAHLRWIQPAT